MLSNNATVDRPSSVEGDARRAVAEMVANGARFTITCRDNGNPDFLWELPHDGNRSACRKIISEAKQNTTAYWRAFVEQAGGPAR